jgi:hypothetical protein
MEIEWGTEDEPPLLNIRFIVQEYVIKIEKDD